MFLPAEKQPAKAVVYGLNYLYQQVIVGVVHLKDYSNVSPESITPAFCIFYSKANGRVAY